MATNGTKRRYTSPDFVGARIRKAPHMQKKLFCYRLYQEWLDGLSENHLNKIVNQLIKQGHDFRPGKE